MEMTITVGYYNHATDHIMGLGETADVAMNMPTSYETPPCISNAQGNIVMFKNIAQNLNHYCLS